MKITNISKMKISIDQGVWHYEIEPSEEKEFPDYLANIFLSRWSSHVIPSNMVEEYEKVINDKDFEEILDIDDGINEEKKEGDL